MPRPMTEQERQDFLTEPRVAVLSVARDGGRPPLAVPVWYAYEPGGNLSFFTGTKARKAQLVEQAGVLSMTVQNPEVPYKYVTVEGTLVSTDSPPSAEQLLAVARRYLPADLAQELVKAELENPDRQIVLFTVRPDRWLTSDFTEDSG